VTPDVDAETLRRLYHEEGLTQAEIAERVGVSNSTISRRMQQHDIRRRKPGPRQKSGGNPVIIRWLYHGKGLTLKEVGKRLGIHANTVRRRMQEYDISRRSPIDNRDYNGRRNPKWVPYTYYYTRRDGYERWISGADGRQVRVHRLAAVAWFGYDAVVGNHVHHVNDIPWDNREANLQPIDPSEHQSLHTEEKERDDDGRFI
jgi:transposase